MKYLGFLAIAGIGLMSTASAQVRSVSGFHSISNDGSFAIHVKIDGTESLKITGADAEEASEIETKVDGDQLKIGWKRESEPHNFNGRVDIYVTAKTLTSLANSGSGSLDVDGSLTGSQVDVTSDGSGRITTGINGPKLDITMRGSGAVRLNGKTGSMEITMDGSGGLHADGLTADEARVVMSGSGTAEIHVDKTLSATIDGSGGVRYSGNGAVSSVTTNGSGRVRRA